MGTVKWKACFLSSGHHQVQRGGEALAVGTGQRAMHAAAFTKHSTASISRGHTEGSTSSPELLVEICISQQLAMSNRIN